MGGQGKTIREDRLRRGRAGLGTEGHGEKQGSEGSHGELHDAGQLSGSSSRGQIQLGLGDLQLLPPSGL